MCSHVDCLTRENVTSECYGIFSDRDCAGKSVFKALIGWKGCGCTWGYVSINMIELNETDAPLCQRVAGSWMMYLTLCKTICKSGKFILITWNGFLGATEQRDGFIKEIWISYTIGIILKVKAVSASSTHDWNDNDNRASKWVNQCWK